MDFLALMREERKQLLAKQQAQPKTACVPSTTIETEHQAIDSQLAGNQETTKHGTQVGKNAETTGATLGEGRRFGSFAPLHHWKSLAMCENWLDSYKVAPHLDSVFYVPDYVDENEV
jgi:hypothetical protein